MNRKRFVKPLTLFNLLALSTLLYAAEPTEKPQEPFLYAYAYLGNNIGNTHSGALESVDYKGSGPGEWGFGFGHYMTDTISIEGSFEYFGERFERNDGTTIPGTYNNVIQVTSMGPSASVLYHYKHAPFHLYLGAGVGYYSTGVLVTDPGSGLFTSEGAPSDKWFAGYHADLGVTYNTGIVALGLALKHRILYVDFDAYTDGKADVGGTCLLFVISSDF